MLGGSPCSGKSSIAARLAEEYGWQFYKIDDHEQAHHANGDPERHPIMHQFNQMSWETIWMRPVELQVAEEFSYYRERFEMIVHDLAAFDPAAPLIMEGVALLPELVAANGGDPARVLYLVPTREFQWHHYGQRPWIHSILNQCTDPAQAFENWMMRDHLFGREVLRQAEAKQYRTILVDGKMSLDMQYEQIKQFLGLT